MEVSNEEDAPYNLALVSDSPTPFARVWSPCYQGVVSLLPEFENHETAVKKILVTYIST